MTGREFPTRPWVGIGTIIFRGEAVLLARRGKPPRLGSWSLPGGAQHLGEGAEACATAMRDERVACEDLLTGSPPAACAGAFANVREASTYSAAISTVAAQYVVLP